MVLQDLPFVQELLIIDRDVLVGLNDGLDVGNPVGGSEGEGAGLKVVREEVYRQSRSVEISAWCVLGLGSSVAASEESVEILAWCVYCLRGGVAALEDCVENMAGGFASAECVESLGCYLAGGEALADAGGGGASWLSDSASLSSRLRFDPSAAAPAPAAAAAGAALPAI